MKEQLKSDNLRAFALCGMAIRKEIDEKSLSDIMERTKRALDVTHGKDHLKYILFQTMKQMLERHGLEEKSE